MRAVPWGEAMFPRKVPSCTIRDDDCAAHATSGDPNPMIKKTKSLTGLPFDLSLTRAGILLVLPALFVITTTAQAQTTSGRAADSAYISQGESHWAESMANHNANAVGRILVDDFIEIGVTGTRYTKTDAVNFQPSNVVSNHVDSLEIRFYGNVAIAFGSEAWRERRTGSAGRNLWTDTWVRRSGKWQVVAWPSRP